MTPGNILDRRKTMYLILRALNAANVPGNDIVQQVEALIAENGRFNAERERMLARPNADRVREMIDADRSVLCALMADDALDRAEVAEGADRERLDAEAMGWRWLSLKRKWPTQEKIAKEWVWGWMTEERRDGEPVVPSSSTLPGALHAIVRETIYRDRFGYSTTTARAALEAVVLAFINGWREPKIPSIAEFRQQGEWAE